MNKLKFRWTVSNFAPY